MRLRSKIILIIIFTQILTACSANQPLLTKAPLANNSAYPAQQASSTDAAYPSPQNQDTIHPDAIEVSKPNSGFGVVTGRLITADSNTPYLGALIYLGPVAKPDKEGFPVLVGISPESDPKAVQAKDGSFVFKDVKPGEYGIVLWTPISSNLVKDKTDSSVIVKVDDGQTVTLGDLFVR